MTDLLYALLAPFCEVHVEHDGFAALSAFRRALFVRKPFELVCLDLLMPGMDGRRTLRAMRRLEMANIGGVERRARMVMMTTQRERELVLEAVDAGVNDYLIKPFEPTTLLARLGLIEASASSALAVTPSEEP